MAVIGCLMLVVLPILGLVLGAVLGGPVAARWGAAIGLAIALIVCGFTFLAALMSFFSGLQLENSTQRNRQDFEITLMRIQHDMWEGNGSR